MKITCLRLIATCATLCVSGSALAVDVSLGDWLHEDTEGLSSISGSGDTFTASPGNTASATDPFAARQKVYQIFGQAVDFSNTGDEISIVFDVVMNGVPDTNDTDFRMSMIDTSTNQGIYPFSFDLGGRVGTYNRARFVDQLDGDLDDGPDAWGGSLIDAINGDGTVAQSPGGGPTIDNGAEELGLVQGNTMHFDVYLRRESNGAIFFSTLVTEANGDVTYPEVAGTYNPVNPTSGDTTVRGETIDQFDGIVFGIFDDAPFLQDGDYNGDGDVNAADYTLWRDNVGQDEGTLPNDPNNDGGVIGDDQYNTWRDQYGASDGSYTVSNLSVVASSLVPASSAASSAPEPAAALLALIGGVAFVGRRTNRG